VANSIFAHVRINTSVYEMFEMRPKHSRVTKDIVIKNDPGAEITLVAPHGSMIGHIRRGCCATLSRHPGMLQCPLQLAPQLQWIRRRRWRYICQGTACLFGCR